MTMTINVIDILKRVSFWLQNYSNMGMLSPQTC